MLASSPSAFVGDTVVIFGVSLGRRENISSVDLLLLFSGVARSRSDLLRRRSLLLYADIDNIGKASSRRRR